MRCLDRRPARGDIDRDAGVHQPVFDLLLAIDMEVALAAEHGGYQRAIALPIMQRGGDDVNETE